MMTDEVDMQIDADSLPPTSFDSSTLNLTNVDLEALTTELKIYSTRGKWSRFIEANTNDTWSGFLENVLPTLTMVLSTTSLERKVIAPLNHRQAKDMISGFNNEQLNKWKHAMRNSLENDDWVDLIQLTGLKNPRMPNEAKNVPVELQDAVICAWNQVYLGDAHQVLLKAMDELHTLSSDRKYANIMPIVQSSGTGKSRTVDRIGLERILFPMCLREDLGPNLFAYPLPDSHVRDHLQEAPSTSDESACKQYLRKFLSSLFILAHLLSQQLFPGNGMIAYEHMAKTFHAFFGRQSMRLEFYEQVVRHAKNNSDVKAWQFFDQLATWLKRRCPNWPINSYPIFISLDEIHVLCCHRNKDIRSSDTLYSHFKSVLDELPRSVGVMCMSTAIHIATNPVPSTATAPSMHARRRKVHLPPPFTELPFDVHLIAKPLAPGQETLFSVGSLEFTARFGRPLFYATYQSRKDERMLSILKEKLCGRFWPPQRQTAYPALLDVSSIAILSARLQLNLYPASVGARRYEEELVRNHLRLLYSVSKDGRIIVTGYSPEPLLAEASAKIMHYTLADGKPYIDFWGLLWRYVDHGLASQGATGELIGRALSISAMDRAIDSLPSASVRELKYQTPVTVTDYYQTLLTDEAWEELRHSVPANCAQLSLASANKTFEDAFKGGYFHFSHYGRAKDCSPIQNKNAWAYWLRGSAIACPLDEELADRMTPIYFPELGRVSPETMSANLDQDKTGESVSRPTVPIDAAGLLSIFSQGTPKLPYITAMHCYAFTEDQGISVCQASSPNLGTQEVDAEAPCYQIDFRGLSAYASVTDADKEMIRRMVDRSRMAVFAFHPRDYGVASLKRMLPVLKTDRASREWYDGDDPAATAPPSIVPTSSEVLSPRTAKRPRSASPSSVIPTPPQVAMPASSVASTSRKKQKRGKGRDTKPQ